MCAEVSKLFTEIITALSLVLDLEKYKQLYHARRVAVVASKLAEEAIPAERVQIFYAGLLHDIGAIAVEDHVVNHPSLEEQIANPYVRAHPQLGTQIVSAIPNLNAAAALILDHHEWWNGKGYPSGKQGEEIPLGAQLLRIADSLDINLREIQRPSWSRICQKMKALGGEEFSPEVFSLFLQVFEKGNLFYRVVDDFHLSLLFYEMAQSMPRMTLPPFSDALGICLRVFAQVIDAKHGYTAGHSERVSTYCVELAEAMGLPHDEVTKIKFAAYLHDAGKVSVPRSTLDKSTGLDANEWELVQAHPILTMEILSTISDLRELAEIAGHHHERYDGQGYPDRLRGKEIPLLARIMTVADAFDAMTSPRSYQGTKTIEDALVDLRGNAETQFDPEIVEVARAIWGEKEKVGPKAPTRKAALGQGQTAARKALRVVG